MLGNLSDYTYNLRTKKTFPKQDWKLWVTKHTTNVEVNNSNDKEHVQIEKKTIREEKREKECESGKQKSKFKSPKPYEKMLKWIGCQEMKIEIIKRYHFLRLAKILKSDNTIACEAVGKKKLVHGSSMWLCSPKEFEHFTLATSILDSNIFSDMCFVNIFFQSDLSFHLLNSIFCRAKVFNLNHQIFSFMDYAFDVVCKNPLPNPTLPRFSPTYVSS